MGAVQSALAGYLYSLDYARQRPQGRPVGNKDPESPQIMISEHADIKRMLMSQKASVEGAYTLMHYCAQLIDDIKLSDNKEEQDRLNLLLELLTPICKSWPSEYCLEANKLAIQILGGYGYTREYPVERFYRDNRLNHIHEGTWAIHGIDILGRKVRIAGGGAVKILAEEIKATIAAASEFESLSAYGAKLINAMKLVEDTLAAVGKSNDHELALANATLFLNAVGHIVIAWMWLKQAVAASKGLQSGNAADKAFYEGKIAANRYFFKYELPRIRADLDIVASLDDTCLGLTAEQFVGV
jgi:butyryl-CoA dehydrogenase